METVAVAEQNQPSSPIQDNLRGCATFSPSYRDREKIPEKKIWLTPFLNSKAFISRKGAKAQRRKN
ncbi:MAG: hypothetical protein ACHQ2F_10165 [Desulfobaccales bacterium]